MHKSEIKNYSRIRETKLPSEESHPATDHLGENRRNPEKKQEKSLSRHKFKYNNNKQNMVIFYMNGKGTMKLN